MSTKKVVAIVVLTNLMIVALLLAFLSTAGVVGAFPPGPQGPEAEAITVGPTSFVTPTIPDANYDSGWVKVDKGTTKKFTLGLGGPVDDYLVEVVCKDTASDGDQINQDYYGVAPGAGGIAWFDLTNNIIKVYREKHDPYCDKVRVRIWITGAPIYTGP